MKIRAVVPVKDEEALLPAFLRHYAGFCDSIVVWDNGSTDRTVEIARAHPKVEVRSFRSEGFDTPSVLRVLGETRRESVGAFDWCLFPDCDELVMSRIRGDERRVLEGAVADVLVPRGYCLVQRPGEGALDPARDVLSQRRWGYRSGPESAGHYSKPIVLRPGTEIEWAPGRHEARFPEGTAVADSPDLVLIHCDTADFDLWIRRKMRPISPGDRARGLGVRRWDRPRAEYDAIWAEYRARARNLDPELPEGLSDEGAVGAG